ncbi:MAG: MlaE family lipid ABC transporter permease subunit [Burkholderiales bacterium]|nr:MlaE family lipid ABC transporter permease subunit [Burkholderiales bacterium]
MPESTTATVGATVTLLEAGHRLVCGGDWSVHGIAGLRARLAKLSWDAGGELVVDFSQVTRLDTAGVWVLHHIVEERAQHGQTVRVDGMRAEYAALQRLVESRAPQKIAPLKAHASGPLVVLGYHAWHWFDQTRGMLHFVGENTVALLHALKSPRHLRFRPILANIQQAGFDALPIVGLLSFLIGMVIAYQGSVQLARYGANIFIADLVGHATLRELAPMMVAIIVAGRSGSAYAAQIGTMKVTEEIDALRTMGVSPLELLVLPKLIALLIALPLLTVFADFTGVLGGMLVASTQLDVDVYTFLDRFDDAIKVSTFLFGVGKAPVFAMIIALVGCYSGFQARGSADSVGRQTTVSVVQSIFLIIIADAIFSIVASATKLGFK